MIDSDNDKVTTIPGKTMTWCMDHLTDLIKFISLGIILAASSLSIASPNIKGDSCINHLSNSQPVQLHFNRSEAVVLSLAKFSELRDKAIIGIGEVAHGSAGLHELEAQLIKSAIIDLGTRTIGIEAPMGIVERINAKLAPSYSAPFTEDDFSDLYPIWKSKNILNLLQWIYDYNHQLTPREHPVRLIGYDVRLPFYELKELYIWANENRINIAHLERINLVNLPQLKELEMLAYNGRSEEASKKFGEIANVITALASVPKAPLRTKFLVSRVQAWLEVYRKWASSSMEPAYAIRDKNMAWLLQQLTGEDTDGGPTVIIAHLNHLLFNNLELRHSKSHVVAGPVVGNYLHEKYKDKYSVIGLFAKRIQISSPSGPTKEFVTKESSFESLMERKFGSLSLRRVSDISENENNEWYRLGDLEVDEKGLPLAYSIFEMQPSRQFDYFVITSESKSSGLL